MIDWECIKSMPPNLKDGRPVLLWLRAPYSRPELLAWSDRLGCWLTPGEDEESTEGGVGCLVPSHYAAVQPPK